jgi:hypothetical protein
MVQDQGSSEFPPSPLIVIRQSFGRHFDDLPWLRPRTAIRRGSVVTPFRVLVHRRHLIPISRPPWQPCALSIRPQPSNPAIEPATGAKALLVSRRRIRTHSLLLRLLDATNRKSQATTIPLGFPDSQPPAIDFRAPLFSRGLGAPLHSPFRTYRHKQHELSAGGLRCAALRISTASHHRIVPWSRSSPPQAGHRSLRLTPNAPSQASRLSPPTDSTCLF